MFEDFFADQILPGSSDNGLHFLHLGVAEDDHGGAGE